jgi:hypothetical protein
VPHAVATLADYIASDSVEPAVKHAAAGTLEKLIRHRASFLALV